MQRRASGFHVLWLELPNRHRACSPVSQLGARAEWGKINFYFFSKERISALRVQAAESMQRHRRRLRRGRLNAQRRNAGARGLGNAFVPASECGTVRPRDLVEYFVLCGVAR